MEGIQRAEEKKKKKTREVITRSISWPNINKYECFMSTLRGSQEEEEDDDLEVFPRIFILILNFSLLVMKKTAVKI